MKKDFIKARTYSREVADIIEQSWLNFSKEQALEEANKQQQTLNENTKKDNDNLTKSIFEECQREYLLDQFCKGNANKIRFLKIGKGLEKREKILKDWKHVVLPAKTIDAVIKQLKMAKFDHEAELFQARTNEDLATKMSSYPRD